MRAIGALVLVVVGVGTAHAHPVRRQKDPFGPGYASACGASKSWAKVTACLVRGGQKVEIVREIEGAKLVVLRYRAPIDAQLGLYLLERGAWTRQVFYATTNATTELLSFRKTELGFRMEVGTVVATNVEVDDVSPAKALLRRVRTTECRPQKGCITVVTSCDVHVDGKVYWFFHGTVAWSGDGVARVSGDTRFAGMLCRPPPAMLAPLDGDIGDPFE